MDSFSRLRTHQRGASASEYAILVALIASIIYVAVTEFYGISDIYQAVTGKIQALINGI